MPSKVDTFSHYFANIVVFTIQINTCGSPQPPGASLPPVPPLPGWCHRWPQPDSTAISIFLYFSDLKNDAQHDDKMAPRLRQNGDTIPLKSIKISHIARKREFQKGHAQRERKR